jgi:hypothetical protein
VSGAPVSFGSWRLSQQQTYRQDVGVRIGCGDVQPSQIVVRSRRLRELTVDGGRKTRSQTPSMLEKVTYGAPREEVKTARRTFSIASITEDTYLVCRSTLGPARRSCPRPTAPTHGHQDSRHLAGRRPRRSGFGAAAPRGGSITTPKRG